MANEEEEVRDPVAVLAELRRAQEDLKNLRADYKALSKEKDDALAALDNNDVDAWRNRALSAETKSALRDQGVKDVDRLIKYVGTEGLDFDDDGKLTGLDDRLKQLKTDLPEIFDAKRRAGNKGDIFANDSAEPKADPFREAVHNALHK